MAVLRGLTTISHLPTITAYFQKRQSAARPQHGSRQLSQVSAFVKLQKNTMKHMIRVVVTGNSDNVTEHRAQN